MPPVELDLFDAYLADTSPPINGNEDPFEAFISGPRTITDNDNLLAWRQDPLNP
jgi:hypothetical protein